MTANPLEEFVFRLSMRAHTGHPKGDLSHRKATFSVESYDEWRSQALVRQFSSNFSDLLLQGKRVLDFGCGCGALSFYAESKGARSVIGTDLIPDGIERAIEESHRAKSNCSFQLERDSKGISLPDNSQDVILCFDVMEHVMDYRDIIQEFARVLSPGGRILIWWSVWWHPYGHHLHTLIPLPWVHAILSDEALLRICARIYDSPYFQPRIWHFDKNQQRKSNPYKGKDRFGDLNKLTIKKFDDIVHSAGLVAARKEVKPFSGNSFGAVKRMLVKSPWPDFFCSAVIYELEKPKG